MKYLIESINKLNKEDIEYIENDYPLRFKKANKYRSEEDFKRCILAYVLLIKLVGDFDEDDIYFGDTNKPYIKGKPFFNISHSGEYAAVVVDNKEVGIDIQKIDEKNLKLARFFTKEEQNYIKEKDSLRRFHELWSIKESAMKMVGKGITLGFSKVKVLNDETVEINGEKANIKKEAIGNDYSLCICYKR